MHLLDLSELDLLDRRLTLFGVDRSRPVAFRRRDHLGDPRLPLMEALRDLFHERGVPYPGGRVLLLTHCAVFGYAFNPVSVFWCHDREERLAAVVVDIRNTFGERYPHILRVDDPSSMKQKKRMHVSPYFSLAGSYAFDLPVPGDEARLGIDLHHGDDAVLVARLRLERRPFTDANLARLLLAYPLMPLMVMAHIHGQALRLWLKGARLFHKPKYDPMAATQEPA